MLRNKSCTICGAGDGQCWPTPEEYAALLKAANEAYKLLETVVPAGNYGGTTSKRYGQHLERIAKVHSLLDNALADIKGLP